MAGKEKKQKLEARFYRHDNGTEPVRDWLKALPKEVMKEIGSDIQKGLVDTIGGGVFEVRTKVDKVQYRVLFCIRDSTMVLLHGFVKKVRAAQDEVAVGKERKKDVDKE